MDNPSAWRTASKSRTRTRAARTPFPSHPSTLGDLHMHAHARRSIALIAALTLSGVTANSSLAASPAPNLVAAKPQAMMIDGIRYAPDVARRQHRHLFLAVT